MLNDKLIILGSGGGRHHIRTQYRGTGGLLFKFSGIQAHIDPGPGAIVKLNELQEDPTKTDLFIVTHFHLDHYSDLSAIIEGSREVLHDKKKRYYKIGTLITTEKVIRYISDYHLNMLEKQIIFHPGDVYQYKPNVKLVGTKIEHADVDGFGLKFILEDYTLTYTSDTKVFEGLAKQYNGTDILIVNLLRPNSVYCKRHLCTDQFIPYINKITPTPKTIILTHFGAYMDSDYSKKNFVPGQVEKIKQLTNVDNVIAAQDGLSLAIKDLL